MLAQSKKLVQQYNNSVHKLAFDILFNQIDRYLSEVPALQVRPPSRLCFVVAVWVCTCIGINATTTESSKTGKGTWLFTPLRGEQLILHIRPPHQAWSSMGGVGGMLGMPSFSLTQQNYVTQVRGLAISTFFPIDTNHVLCQDLAAC